MKLYRHDRARLKVLRTSGPPNSRHSATKDNAAMETHGRLTQWAYTKAPQ